jgi:hypothetical protein
LKEGGPMKVKDLAVIFKVEVSELLAMLSNVGVNLDKQEETNIDSSMEKKLAKRYGIPYPFKTAPKPKPVNKVVIPNAKETKEAPKQNTASKPQTNQPKKNDSKGANQETNNKKVSNNNGRNETPKQTPTKKQEAPKQEVKETKEVKQPKPQTIILQKDEIVAPRVDEETLNKYSHFLDDDEYNITRENRPKKNTYGNKESESKSRKKNVKNNKNKQTEN